MTTTAEFIRARDDKNLRERLIATAQMLNVPDPEKFVDAKMPDLVKSSIQVNNEQTSIVAVYTYADNVRTGYLSDARASEPGLNPSAVTDPILAAAVQSVLVSQ